MARARTGTSRTGAATPAERGLKQQPFGGDAPIAGTVGGLGSEADVGAGMPAGTGADESS